MQKQLFKVISINIYLKTYKNMRFKETNAMNNAYRKRN